MERLKHIKNTLLSAVESQLGDLSHVDAKELGEVVDMVKDMEEAMYYCTIVKAMEERQEEEKHSPKYMQQMPYIPPMYYQTNPRDIDRSYGRMYYGEGNGRGNTHVMEHEGEPMPVKYNGSGYPTEIRDVREGRSPISRKNYMESKELHQGTPAQMKELEKYMQELTQDITEMIADASPEEKSVLQQKLSILASKIK